MAFEYDTTFDNGAPIGPVFLRYPRKLIIYPTGTLPTGDLTVLVNVPGSSITDTPIFGLDLGAVTSWPLIIDLYGWPQGEYNISTTEATNPMGVILDG